MWWLLCVILLAIGSIWLFGYALPTGKHLSNTHWYPHAGAEYNDFLPEANYEKNRMFTEYEKKCYRALCDIAEAYGFTVFAKVPLCYLVSPRPRLPNYDRVLGRLGIAYADFVLCDSYLKVTMIVTLELSNTDVLDGPVRDHRRDAILKYCGVDVLHTTSIDMHTREWIASHCDLDT